MFGKIKRLFGGYAPKTKKVEQNMPCYDKDGHLIGWYSRSIACATFLFCRDTDGVWHVLASERGPEAADFRGLYNCPCGYLDFNETCEECATRELHEECGVVVSPRELKLWRVDSSPKSNRQNVTMLFYCILNDAHIEDFVFSKELNEGDEVGEIRWVALDEIDRLEWAFGHKDIIRELSKNAF